MTHKLNQARGLGDNPDAKLIVPWLRAKFNPASVLDIGCGSGAFLREFTGIPTIGMDRHAYGVPQGFEHYHKIDLEGIYRIPPRDMVLCLETAEHLSPPAGETLVRRICLTEPAAVIWSAAVPLQGGYGHRNEQWQSYWARRFNMYGYHPYDDLRLYLWHRNVSPWYAQNTLIYCKPSVGKTLNLTIPALLDIIHPRLWTSIGLMGTMKRLI